MGEDRKVANTLFDELQGNRTLADDHLLHIDLMETVDELPTKIKTISCTINQLAENTKLIARETFKQKNLKAYDE
ncbi:hypothetical protein [Mucilaginibacter antarcticus]|uniref:hypothetical protein n=1 Tax=Mucilaginibacter antarcticus TaxID=1855725 RepID=UPI0036273BAE